MYNLKNKTNKMNKKSIYNYVSALSMASILVFSACKGKDKDPETPAKTLNKTTLLNKLWHGKGGFERHEFKSDGTYIFTGTWKWINNTDTMEIDSDGSGSAKIKWKINWNTDKEMEAVRQGSNNPTLFKDAPWN